MEVTLLLLADYANVAEGNKLNVMGIFTNLFSAGFPTMHAQMYLVMQMSASPAEYGRKCTITIKLLDEDARQTLIDLPIEREVPGGEGRRVSINQIIRLTTIVFPQPGTYQFSVLIDNDEKATLALDVIKQPPQIN